MATTAELPDLTQYDTDELEDLRDEIEVELDRRRTDVDLDDAISVELVNGRWLKWKKLSRHPNLKATKAWIMKVTGDHDKYSVDGEWLNKKKIGSYYHMDVSDIEAGDIIKVSGASHTNKKHRYYRILERTENHIYCESMSETDVIEEVSGRGAN